MHVVGSTEEVAGLVGRLMYLVDSNIWLELLLEQERSMEVRQFLQAVEASEPSLSKFTLYFKMNTPQLVAGCAF